MLLLKKNFNLPVNSFSFLKGPGILGIVYLTDETTVQALTNSDNQ